MRVEDLRMRDKLAAVLVVPMIAMTLLAGHTLLREYQRMSTMTQLAHAGERIQATGNLVHELQAERGRASLSLSDGDDALAGEQTRQRAATDAAWQVLEKTQAGATDLPTAYLAEQRAKLVALRGQIDRRALTAARAIEQYSLLVREFIARLEGLSNAVPDAEVARQANAYQALIRAKEAAGQERAQGGRWLSGAMELGLATRLVELESTQKLLLEQFAAMAPAEMLGAHRAAAQASCVAELEKLRTALHSPGTSRPAPQQWFEAASCRMERLHDVENAFAQHLFELTRRLHDEARLRLGLILLVSLAPFLPSLWLIVRVTRNVSEHSRGLLTAMQGIAGGNFNVALPPGSQDELGELGSGLEELRDQLARHTREQAQLLRRERELAAVIERRGREVEAFAQQVAAGNLAGRLEEGDDTLGRLAASLNRMAEGLVGLAGRVRETGNALVTTVAQMQGAVSAQTAGASEQAAAVSQTMTTLDEIRATSVQTLDKARLLGEVAERAHSEGEQGRHMVEESIAGMNEVNRKVDAIAHTILSLNEQTQRVGEITTAVGAIARQLRLLSLNAAIEATKAGEAGQGFAVVAAEVKQLAEQSQQSTEQVQRILLEIRHATDRAVMATEDGAKGVAHGLELAQRAGEAIRGLGQVVRDTSLASRQIVAAVRQEGAGIEQIATAMGDIHKVTAQFVSATGQTHAATEELSFLAQRLSAAANQYKT